MPLVPDPKNCDISVKRAIQLLSKKLGYTGTPTFDKIILSGLAANRLIATDENSLFTVVPGTDVNPEFDGITIKNGSGNVIFHVNHDELYFTECPTDPVTGNPIGLLLALTYTV